MEFSFKKFLTAPLIAAVGLAVAGCSMPIPEPESIAFKLYEQKCNLCHPVYSPKLLDKKTWGYIIKRMEKKVKATGVREPLTNEEAEVILGYLQKHARERGM